MKNLLFFLLPTLLLCSCNKDTGQQGEESIAGDWENIRVRIVIVDTAYNDRMNPASPSYFGQEYADGIEVLYLYEGEKRSFQDYYRITGGGVRFFIEDVENWPTISPPTRKRENGNIDQGTLGYYFIDCTSGTRTATIEDGKEFTHTYIRYPDGSEDELKLQIYRNATGSMTLIDKFWINGELVCEPGDFRGKESYYNPKYYPWTKPVFDDAGKQVGIMPEGDAIVVLTR